MMLSQVLALPITEDDYVTSQTVGDDRSVVITMTRRCRSVLGMAIDEGGVCWYVVDIDGRLMRERAGEVALVHRER